jgi:hypothetical protein
MGNNLLMNELSGGFEKSKVTFVCLEDNYLLVWFGVIFFFAQLC